MAESLEDLLGAYWDIAYQEGRSGGTNGTQAQEVLSAIRAVVEQAVAPYRRDAERYQFLKNNAGFGIRKNQVTALSIWLDSLPSAMHELDIAIDTASLSIANPKG